MSTITNNEAHVSELIARGDVPEADRHRHLARLYRGQFLAATREHTRRERIRDKERYAAGWVRRWLADTA
jgi:hypothetical protein